MLRTPAIGRDDSGQSVAHGDDTGHTTRHGASAALPSCAIRDLGRSAIYTSLTCLCIASIGTPRLAPLPRHTTCRSHHVADFPRRHTSDTNCAAGRCDLLEPRTCGRTHTAIGTFASAHDTPPRSRRRHVSWHANAGDTARLGPVDSQVDGSLARPEAFVAHGQIAEQQAARDDKATHENGNPSGSEKLHAW